MDNFRPKIGTSVSENGPITRIGVIKEIGETIVVDFGEDIDGNCVLANYPLNAFKTNVLSELDITEILDLALSEDGYEYHAAFKETSIEGKLVIPGFYNDTPITKLTSSYNSYFSCVVLPSTIYTIDSGCFFEWKRLRRIEIHSQILELKEATFSCCENLTSIILPTALERINKQAIVRCDSLKELLIPEGVETIAGGAFRSCLHLTRINLPSSLKNLDSNPFWNCPELLEINFPQGNNKYSFEDGVLYDNNKETALYASNRSHIVIKQGTRHLSQDAFGELFGVSRSEKLSFVILSPELQEIPESAFENCKNLKGVVIQKNNTAFDTVIRADSFKNCESLSHIYLSRECRIDGFPFENCNSLKAIFVKEEKISIDLVPLSFLFPGLLVAREGMFYQDNILFKVTWNTQGFVLVAISSKSSSEQHYTISIPEKVLGLPVVGVGRNFNSDHFLKRIIIPNSIKKIAIGAFAGCVNLEEVVLPPTLRELPAFIFEDCQNLSEVNIPSSVKEIGHYAFSNCKKIRSLVLPDGLKTIRPFTFHGCEEITEIRIPSSVELIEEFAFSYCNCLPFIYFPSPIIKIERRAFSLCRELRYVVIENNAQISVDDRAFGDYNNKVEIIDRETFLRKITP